MPNPLHGPIQSLDDRRMALLQELDGLAPDALQARLRPGTWSVLEILEHVVVAERVILQGLPDQAELVERPRSLQHWINYPLVMLVLKLAIPVKVPSRRMLPMGQRTLADLKDEWDQHLRWLRAFEAGQTADACRKTFFVHPVAGPISLLQALKMDLLHVQIHSRQISTILKHQTGLTARHSL
jgi:hypothetical protein